MRHSQQKGSALVVAIFVVVVLGLLVSTLSRLLVSTSDSVVTEVWGNRAFHTAQSGVNMGMMELFPIVNQEGYSLWEQCVSINEVSFSSTVNQVIAENGLNQCSLSIECIQTCPNTDPQCIEDNRGPFRLVSTATCSSGATLVSRTVAIEVPEQ